MNYIAYNMNYIDFTNICRSCGYNSDLQPIQDNFVIDVFRKLIDINYTKNDELPQKICETCIQTIYNIQKFVLQCKTIDLTLKKYLSKLKNTTCNTLTRRAIILSSEKSRFNANNEILTTNAERNVETDDETYNEVIILNEKSNKNETNTHTEGNNTFGNELNVEYSITNNESTGSERNEIANTAGNDINETNAYEINVEIETNESNVVNNINFNELNETTNNELHVESEINTDASNVEIETTDITNNKTCFINEITIDGSNVINEIITDELNVEIERNDINNELIVNEIDSNGLNVENGTNEITNNAANVECDINTNTLIVETETNKKTHNATNVNQIHNNGLNVETTTNGSNGIKIISVETIVEFQKNLTRNKLSKKSAKDNFKNDQSNINIENKTNSNSKKYVDLETVYGALQNQFPFNGGADLLNRELELVSLKGKDFAEDVPKEGQSIYIPASHLLKFDDKIVIIDSISTNCRKQS